MSTDHRHILRGRSAVVIEDDAVIAIYLAHVLESVGVSVVGRVPDGRAGIELINELHPDFVLLDLRLPDMPGTDVADAVRNSVNTCIIVVSSDTDPRAYTRSQAVGVSGYIPKPVTHFDLLDAISRIYTMYLAGSAA